MCVPCKSFHHADVRDAFAGSCCPFLDRFHDTLLCLHHLVLDHSLDPHLRRQEPCCSSDSSGAVVMNSLAQGRELVKQMRLRQVKA